MEFGEYLGNAYWGIGFMNLLGDGIWGLSWEDRVCWKVNDPRLLGGMGNGIWGSKNGWSGYGMGVSGMANSGMRNGGTGRGYRGWGIHYAITEGDLDSGIRDIAESGKGMRESIESNCFIWRWVMESITIVGNNNELLRSSL